jgi:hypothetical protein
MASQTNMRKGTGLGAVLKTALVLVTMCGAVPVTAATRTLDPVPLAPGLPHVRLTRTLARAELGRSLFGDPAGTALVGQVEIFDRYPYVRARYIQLITDAAWNRVVFGEQGREIHTFDGAGTPFGRLRGPAGIDRDPQGRIFVADALNNRIVVLDLRGDGADLRLEPQFTIDGLKRPSGVAWDGGTTPLDPTDDRLWVADTGNHRVVCYALSPSAARVVKTFGQRGNGDGDFLEPRDIEIGHGDGLHSAAVYVADWGNGRVVQLNDAGAGISWIASRTLGAGVRSLASDAWGNIYVGMRDEGRVVKLTGGLEPVFASGAEFPGLRDLAVGFLTVTDHRDGSRRFTGYATLFALESWSETSGGQRLELGVEALDLAAVQLGRGAELRYLLTDHANIEISVVDGSGRAVRQESLGRQGAGRQAWAWDGKDGRGEWVNGPVGYVLRAASLYPDGGHVTATVGAAAPAVAAIDAPWPNPANPATRIRFTLPATAADVRLDIVDVSGRIRRRLVGGGLSAGAHLVDWNGTDDMGRLLASGTYMVRLEVSGRLAGNRKLTMVR